MSLGKATMSKGKSKKPDKRRILFKDRNHVEWPDPDKQGLGHSELSEDGIIPDYYKRPGDCIINAKTLGIGKDNNSMIILGRDRSGLGEINTKDKKKSQSGFGHHMSAGAIDIVVGRMSPFPIGSLVNDPERPIEVGPAFTTKKNIKSVQAANLYNFNDNGVAVGKFNHPGTVMDAARIYVSQMTDLDGHFNVIRNPLTSLSTVESREEARYPEVFPCSGIMVKADEVRIHARQDVKIVTGGQGETVNSQGNQIVETGKIELIAGNGLNIQHPIPLGDNLQSALNSIINGMEEFMRNYDAYVKEQLKFNASLTAHVHTELGATGMPTLPSLGVIKQGTETTLKQLAQNVIGGGLALTVNFKELRKYLNPADETNYINSRFTTTS